MRRLIIVVLCTMMAACDRSAATSSAAPTAPAGKATVVEANGVVDYVIDGDTVDVVIDGVDERLRLIGIDTPEPTITDRDQVADCFGDEASAFTRTLLPVGTPVRIERDVVPRDDYGRLLGYLYRADDGMFVNLEIIRRGYAQPLTIAPNVVHADRFVEAARAAERDDVGLWSACR